jgi:predicted nucleic acid-binding protein
MARSPSKKFRRLYWDSCTWISLIGNETAVPLNSGGTENRAAMARSVLDDAQRGAAEIVTSALTLAEVNRISANSGGLADTEDKLAAFFENDFIIVSMLDRRIGEMARKLMQKGLPGLKPLDAVHLASALVANVDEMHSFDDDLLDLSEKIDKLDGKPLKISKPALSGPPLPLLDAPPEILSVPPAQLGPPEEVTNDAQIESEKSDRFAPETPGSAESEVHGNGEGTELRRERGELPPSAETCRDGQTNQGVTIAKAHTAGTENATQTEVALGSVPSSAETDPKNTQTS